VVTEALQRQVVEKLGLSADFLPVIRMGVDTDRFKPSEAALENPRIRAVTVARLNRAKGHAIALAALAKLRDLGVYVEYHIAGAGPEQANLQERIRALDLQDRVHLLGSLSEDAVLQLLKDSDVFLLPSFGLGEAAPVSVMEAMACGLPVISTRIGGTTEMIREGQDGLLIAQESSEEIASALGALVSEKELRRRLGAAARDTAVERFDYRKSAALFYERIKAPAR
jgi:glycosyltransferase involved in cell wall biosynthesis